MATNLSLHQLKQVLDRGYSAHSLPHQVGNLIGALFSAAVFSYATQSLHEEPYRSGVIEQVTTDITETQWHVILLKSLASGFLVCQLRSPVFNLSCHILLNVSFGTMGLLTFTTGHPRNVLR